MSYAKTSAGVCSTKIREETGWLRMAPATASTGKHRTLLTLAAATKVTGTLAVQIKFRDAAPFYPLFQHGVARIDVGADGSWELDALGKNTSNYFGLVKQVTLGPSGLKVLTESAMSLPFTLPFELSITFTPTPSKAFQINTFGQTCGPTLTATETPTHGILFSLSGAVPQQMGLLWLGVQTHNLQFPGTACYLYTEPMIPFVTYADPQGKAAWNFAVPSSLRPLAFNSQGASLDIRIFEIKTSKGIKVHCPQ